MSKRDIFVAIWVFALLLTGCADSRPDKDNKNRTTDNTGVQVINLPKSGEDTLKTSLFADTVLYIPLETTDESFMDDLEQLWIDNSGV